ncbi:hypothetical protein BHE74_00041449 [Ensete ventricosum]|nr:hypothetical protein BHE74_00041449 [Ensete ventricosum]
MAQVSSRSRGTVKWFNDTKGFGFISPDDGGEDLFVHQSSIKAEGYRTLAEGEVVEFVVTEGDDGRTKAVDVTGPDGSNVQCGSGGGHSGGARFNGSGGGGRIATRAEEEEEAAALVITVVRWGILLGIAIRAVEAEVGGLAGEVKVATHQRADVERLDTCLVGERRSRWCTNRLRVV